MKPASSPAATILAVDDEYANRFLLEATLSDYRLILAGSAGEMWDVLERDSALPDLILLDVMMPHESGFDAAQKLAATPRYASIPVVFLSARVEAADVAQGLALGGHDYIRKPFDAEELTARVDSALANSQRQNALRQEGSFLRNEIDMARAVHQSLIPDNNPRLPGYTLRAQAEPARLVSGDIYDWAMTGSNLVLVMADIAGKGLQAAMLASSFQTAVRATLEAKTPSRLVERVNEILIKELGRVELFITCAAVYLDVESHTLTVANAGHTPVMVRRALGEISEFAATGPPLGVIDRCVTTEQRTVLCPGDLVLLYSDGVVEAENQALEFFGTERLTALVNDADPGSTQELLDTISQSLHDYTGDYPRSDDVSLLTLGRDPRAVSLTMDADVSRLDELLDLIEAQDHSTSATERYRLQLVASELLTNIIRHGYRGAAGRITSCLTVYPDSLAFEVWDEAPEPFRGTLAPPSEALPAPAGDEEDVADTPEGGYGMQILHTICARVIHEPRTPIGNYWGCFLSRKVT